MGKGKWVFFSFLLFLLGGSILFFSSFSLEKEDYQGVKKLSGLKEEVEIIRDELGVPYIYAKNEEDLAFATGYTMAEDRLWQMYFHLYLAQGRLSEILGESALETDIFMRSLAFRLQVERELSYIRETELMPLLQAFTRGINTYIQEHMDSLPIEFALTGFTPPPWKEENAVYIGILINFFLAVNLYEELTSLYFASYLPLEELAYLFPIYPDEKLPFQEVEKFKKLPFLRQELARRIEPILEKFSSILPASYGSNNWAVAPARSTTGFSLLANDTHLRMTTPSNWYMLYQEMPGLKVVGVTVPGVPFVVLGFNGKIGWGATMVMGDTQDLYVEKIHREKECYFFQGKCIPLKKRKEVFYGRGGKKLLETTLYETHHGPVLLFPGEPLEVALYPSKNFLPEGYALSLRWALYDFNVPPIALYFMGRAGDIESARNVLREIKTICLNVVLADKNHIAWQVTGRYPKRKNTLGLLPSPGFTGEYEWEGYYTFEEQPFRMDPPEGFLYTANHRTVRKEESIPLTHSWYTPRRAERIYAYLSSKEKLSVEDMKILQGDFFSMAYRKIKGIFPLLRKETKDEEVLSLLDFLEKGEEYLEISSSQAVLYSLWYYFFIREVFYEKITAAGKKAWDIFGEFLKRAYNTAEHHFLELEESPFFGNRKKTEILLTSLKKAYAYAKKKLGVNKDHWEWGRIHFYYWEHTFAKAAPFLAPLMNRGPYPAGGDLHSVNVSGHNYTRYPFQVWLIPAMRFIVDFSQEEPVYLILPLGVSGNPFSPFYDSFLPYFVEKRYYKVSFYRKPEGLLRKLLSKK